MPETVNNIKLVEQTATSLKFKWDSSAGADGYEIFRESINTKDSYGRIASLDATTTEYVDEKLLSGTSS